MQFQLLQCIEDKRLSKEQKELLIVLERKFEGKSWRYMNGDGHSGWVKSPVSGKKLGKKQWLQIITNKKLGNRKHSGWKEVEGGFVESTIETYSGDFNLAVKEKPTEMIELVLAHRNEVLPSYIDSLYSGAEFSEYMNQIEQQTWEDMFKAFPCDMESQRASYFCGIIEKAAIYSWSQEIIEQLNNIAMNYRGIDYVQSGKKKSNYTSEELYGKTLNCVRGTAIRAIGHLLWGNISLFDDFRDTIEVFVIDKDPAVRMASFYALWPAYNIDRKWAETRLISVYMSDIRMSVFHGSKDMFFHLYPKYKEEVILNIKRCFESKDKNLIEIGGLSVYEFYLRHDEFGEIILCPMNLNQNQMISILRIAILYLKYDEYREKSKALILACKDAGKELGDVLGNMFYDKLIDLDRDSDFLINIMKSNVSRRMIFSFTHFLEENACSVREYASVIIALSENVLNMPKEELAQEWGIEGYISKLIIALYDETINLDSVDDKLIAEKCIELWDIMFERGIGQIRELSRMLMER